jgi:hypothetical protein
LATALQERFEAAEEGDELVVPMLHRKQGAMLRKPLLAAIKRTGIKAWPRLWHYLRSTRQTELEERFPSHVVCAWLGNNRDTARRHYLQLTDAHFERATVSSEEAAQIAAQQGPAEGRKGQQIQSGNRNEAQRPAMAHKKATPTGFEPVLPG